MSADPDILSFFAGVFVGASCASVGIFFALVTAVVDQLNRSARQE